MSLNRNDYFTIILHIFLQPNSLPGTQEYISTYTAEWREVFLISAEIYVFGAIVYFILGSGHKQWWADGVDKTCKRKSIQQEQKSIQQWS